METKKHKNSYLQNPAIYVGTYQKYNNGNLFGEWVDLTDFTSIKEFYDYCKELHKDEEDPEFMFQDWEYIPDYCIGESWLHEDFWEYLNLNEYDKLQFNLYAESTGYDFNDCLKNYEDIFYFEEGEEENYFFDMYPELYKIQQNNYYVTIDVDQWVNDCFQEVNYNGKTYYVQYN